MMRTASLAITGLLFTLSACELEDNASGFELSSDGAVRHGTWVYGADQTIQTLAGRDLLMSMARCYAITDIYLAVGKHQELLARAELPGFLKRLIGNQVRPDALLSPDAPSSVGEVNALIDHVIAFNAMQTDTAMRFVGVHLDLEPWIGTDMDGSWIQPLIDIYRAASAHAAAAGMPFIADVSGAKMADDNIASPQQRRDMFAAVRRLVLMQYDVGQSSVEAHTNQFLADVEIAGDHDAIAAIRGQDAAWTGAIQADLWRTPGYAGWALYQAPHLSVAGCAP